MNRIKCLTIVSLLFVLSIMADAEEKKKVAFKQPDNSRQQQKLFIFPSKSKAFNSKDYDKTTLYPFVKKWLGDKKKHKQHPLFDPLCKKISGQLNKKDIVKNLITAKKMVKANPSDLIATMFIYRCEKNFWKDAEWNQRLNLLISRLKTDSFYRYYLLWNKAALLQRQPSFNTLRPIALKFAYKHLLSPKESQVVFRMIKETVPTAKDKINLLPAVKMIKKENVWLKKTLLGMIHKELAWQARGKGWADSVSKSGWRGFKHNLQLSKKYLTEAWELHKTSPEAPCIMITVSMGLGSVPDRIKWFNRTIAAQVDYNQAYDDISYSLTPRWGGSIDLMTKLAEACNDGGSYDVKVAIKMIPLLKYAVTECNDYQWMRVYQRPETMEKIDKLFYLARIIDQGDTKENRNYYQAYLAIFNCYAGNYKKSQAIIDKIGWKTFLDCEQNIIKKFSYILCYWLKASDKIKCFNGSYSKNLMQAEKLFYSNQRIAALQVLEQILANKNLNPDERKFIAELWGRYKLNLSVCKYSKGYNSLWKAYKSKNYTLIKKLVEYGVDINHKNEKGHTILLHATAYRPYLQVIKLLVELGADVNTQDNVKSTPLCRIVRYNRPQITDVLIRSGAQIDKTGEQNLTPLMNAIYRKQLANVKILVAAGADVNATVGKHRVWDYVKLANSPTITAYMKKHAAK